MRHAKSFDTYPPDKLREVSRKAGLASGKARREKRAEINRIRLEDKAHRENIKELLNVLNVCSTELLKVTRAKKDSMRF